MKTPATANYYQQLYENGSHLQVGLSRVGWARCRGQHPAQDAVFQDIMMVQGGGGVKEQQPVKRQGGDLVHGEGRVP
jgi:hypothetical protein